MKKLLSMLLAVAMVLSLCVNVFAVKQSEYTETDVLDINGMNTDVKVVLFDSDQKSQDYRVEKLSRDPRGFPTLTQAQKDAGYAYYTAYLAGRIAWSSKTPTRRIAGGGLVVTVKPSVVTGLAPYNAYGTQTAQQVMAANVKTTSFSQIALNTANQVYQYTPGSNMENEETQKIYKFRNGFFVAANEVNNYMTDEAGNYYYEIELEVANLLGKPGDQFQIVVDLFVDTDGKASASFVPTDVATEVNRYWGTTPATVTIPTKVSFDLNGGTGTVPADVDDLGKGDKIAMPPVGDRTKPNAVLVGWSKEQKTSLITDRSQLPADMGPVGGEYTLTDPTVQKLYAVWAEHKLPDPVDDEGDPIPTPDYAKVIVNFELDGGEGGKWKVPDGTTKQVVLVSDDSGNAKLQSTDIPSVAESNIVRGLKRLTTGKWSLSPATATPQTPNTTDNLTTTVKTYNYKYTLDAKGVTYGYYNGETGARIELDPNNPSNPDPSTAPTLNTPVYGTDGKTYIVTDIASTPDDDNEVKVTTYPSTDGKYPDFFLKEVTFKIRNGYWNGSNDADKTEKVPVMQGGKYVVGTDGKPAGTIDWNEFSTKIPSTTGAAPKKGSKAGTGVWIDPKPIQSVVTTYGYNDEAVFTFSFSNYVYIDGDTGNEIPVNPNDPRNPSDPKPGDKIIDLGGNNYIVGEVPTDPTTPGGPIEVISYLDDDKDGVPDQFEVNITFHIDNGYWSGTDAADKKLPVIGIKYNDGYKWDEVNNRPMGQATYTVQDTTNVRPDSAHDLPGDWVSSDPASFGKPTGTILGSDVTGKGPYDVTFFFDFESKDIKLTDEGGLDISVLKVLRPVGNSHADTNEPLTEGYDPRITSRTVYVKLGDDYAAGDAANVTRVNGILEKATYQRYTRNGWEDVSKTDITKYMDKLEAKIDSGKIGVTFTSKAVGVIKVTFENGSEFAFVTPGDINLDGFMNDNDWINIMRWRLIGTTADDVLPTDSMFTNFKVNNESYNLWMLMGDMKTTDVVGENTKVNDNDWIIIMRLRLQAWK
ncbi:MAG: hypothetical protein IJU78_05355 [Clostridia bacterium]|nr:hypothetical protein [Clostridia bacterium]